MGLFARGPCTAHGPVSSGLILPPPPLPLRPPARNLHAFSPAQPPPQHAKKPHTHALPPLPLPLSLTPSSPSTSSPLTTLHKPSIPISISTSYPIDLLTNGVSVREIAGARRAPAAADPGGGSEGGGAVRAGDAADGALHALPRRSAGDDALRHLLQQPRGAQPDGPFPRRPRRRLQLRQGGRRRRPPRHRLLPRLRPPRRLWPLH
uniref:Uncharacterized protein n=1 Tax=Leersia perrieri TaxID=77586 RepID=A0A0D9UYD1_9ORYZ